VPPGRGTDMGVKLLLVGMTPPVAQLFSNLGVMALVADENRHTNRIDSLRHAAEILGVTKKAPAGS